jgi:DNA repair protein RadC
MKTRLLHAWLVPDPPLPAWRDLRLVRFTPPPRAAAPASPAAAACGDPRPLLTARETAQIEQAQALLRERLMNAHPRRPRPQDFERYLHLQLATERRERLVALFLGPGDELIGEEQLFSGDRGQVMVHIPEIVAAAFERRADGVLLAHNHPCGPALPSDPDRNTVAAVARALDAVQLRYVDDIIVARDATYSHRRAGTLR